MTSAKPCTTVLLLFAPTRSYSTVQVLYSLQMGRTPTNEKPCAVLNLGVRLYKECDVCRAAAEQPLSGQRRQWTPHEWLLSGLTCARIAAGPADPELCVPPDAGRPRRTRAAAAADSAAPLRNKPQCDDRARRQSREAEKSGVGRHRSTSPETPAGAGASGVSGTATHILSLAGTGATAAILRGKATAHKGHHGYTILLRHRL
jgi:hypothetical protein